MPATIFDRPSPAVPVRSKDRLRVSFWGRQGTNRLVKLTIRFQYVTGEEVGIVHQLVPARDGDEDIHEITLTDGYITAITMHVFSGTVEQGELYCRVGLQRGSVFDNALAQTFIADYLSTGYDLNYPAGILKPPAGGPGHVAFESKTAPSAGSEFDFSFGTNIKRHVHSFMTTLTTDANVANRRVHLTLEYNDNKFLDIPASATQAASTTKTYMFAHGIQNAEVDDVIMTSIPANIIIVQDIDIVTATTNIQVGDQFTDLEHITTEWIEEQL